MSKSYFLLAYCLLLLLVGCGQQQLEHQGPTGPQAVTDSQNYIEPDSLDQTEHQPIDLKGYRIAFFTQCGFDGEFSLNLFNSDSGKIITLADNVSTEECFAWSPNGERIAFVSTEIGGWEIYVVNADGSGLTRLTGPEQPSPYGGSLNYWPSWSPDGMRITFHSFREYAADIFIIDSDGSNEIQLTGTLQDEEGSFGNDFNPAWSPDGSRIAFISGRENTYDIYTMNTDGTGITRLTNNEAPDGLPIWSPDGSRIAFTRAKQDGTPSIYVMNSDGSRVFKLTPDTSREGIPAWSPDGQYIAFHSNRDGEFQTEIYVIASDGSNQTRLTYNPDYSYLQPSWSPDGRYIAFVSFPDIYVMNSDGTGLINITQNDPSHCSSYSPSWAPR